MSAAPPHDRASAIRLVCVDVDGTLVGASAVVDPDTWHAADRARAAGIHLAICSGRPAFGVTAGYAERLDGGGWHIFQNGASIVRPSTGSSRSAALPAAAIAALIARARATGRVLELYTDTDYAVEGDPPVARRHAELLGMTYRPRPFSSLDAPVVRAQWLVPHEALPALLAEPHDGLERFPSTTPIMPDTVFVNLTAAGITKASAVRTLAEEYGVPLAQVMYVGDGHNDVPAMAVVGHPVAMANAEPEVHAIARHTVAHVDAGGLVEALALAIAAARGPLAA